MRREQKLNLYIPPPPFKNIEKKKIIVKNTNFLISLYFKNYLSKQN